MMKKLLIALAVFLLLLIAAVVSIPFLFKDKIADAVRQEINGQLTATVNYRSFDLSILRTFPNLNFSMQDFTVVCKEPFKQDTLLQMKSFNVVLDLMSVWKGGEYKVVALKLREPIVKACLDKAGKANWEVFKEEKQTGATSSSPLKLSVKDFKIENGSITYKDQRENTQAHISSINYNGNADVSGKLYDMDVDLDIASLSYSNGPVAYLSQVALKFVSRIQVDNIQSKYSLQNSELTFNDLKLKIDGWVKRGKAQTDMDLTFAAAETSFKSILSMIPAIYKKDFNAIQASGQLALSGDMKGSLRNQEYPAMNLNLSVKDGMFKYPSLPSAVSNIQLQATYRKPQGTLNSGLVDISQLHLVASGNPVDARIRISTPVTDPDVEAMVKGKIDLKTINAFYPMEGVRKLEGLLNADIDFKGRKSDMDNKRYDKVKADGNLSATGIVYDSKDNPMPVYVPTLSIAFNPLNVKVSNCIARIGRSDFRASGYVDNFVGYVFGKGDLTGDLQLQSSLLDANELLKKDPNAATTSQHSATTDYFRVPKNIRFSTTAIIGTLPYEKMTLKNVKGTIRVADEQILMEHLSSELFKGTAVIDGYYSTQREGKPEAHLSYVIQNFDITELYTTVGLSEKLAPVMKHLVGTVSSDMKLDMDLKPDMSIDYNSLSGDGKVSIPHAKIVGMPLLQEINKVIKIPLLQNLELKDAWTIVRFKDGKVNVDPTDFKFGNGYNVNVAGWNSFDRVIDFTIRLDVPGKEMAQATGLVQQYIPKLPGVSFAMPEKLNIFLKATGSTDKPKVSLQKISADGKNSIQEVLVDKAKEEARKLEEAAKKRAQEEADKLKKQAEQRAKTEADKLKKQAEDKLKKEAGNKVKDVLKWPK